MLVPSYHAMWHIAEDNSPCAQCCAKLKFHTCVEWFFLMSADRLTLDWYEQCIYWLLFIVCHIVFKKNHPISHGQVFIFPFLGGSFKCTSFSVHLPTLKTTQKHQAALFLQRHPAFYIFKLWHLASRSSWRFFFLCWIFYLSTISDCNF